MNNTPKNIPSECQLKDSCPLIVENKQCLEQVKVSESLINDLLNLVEKSGIKQEELKSDFDDLIDKEDIEESSKIVKNLISIVLEQVETQKQLNNELNGVVTKLKEENLTLHKDQLTGLYNRHHFNTKLIELKESGENFSLGIIDIDFFKKINDSFGHTVGDVALRYLASKLKLFFNDDEIYRFGGEEFIIIGKMDSVSLKKKLEALMKITGKKLTMKQNKNVSFKLSFSGGIIQGNQTSEEKELIDCADKLLYKAKADGRSRIYIS